jgi:hypothetical protein
MSALQTQWAIWKRKRYDRSFDQARDEVFAADRSRYFEKGSDVKKAK